MATAKIEITDHENKSKNEIGLQMRINYGAPEGVELNAKTASPAQEYVNAMARLFDTEPEMVVGFAKAVSNGHHALACALAGAMATDDDSVECSRYLEIAELQMQLIIKKQNEQRDE